MSHWRTRPRAITSARPHPGPHKTQKCVTNGPHKNLHGPLVSIARRFSDIILLIAFWGLVMAIFAGPVASLIVLWLDR